MFPSSLIVAWVPVCPSPKKGHEKSSQHHKKGAGWGCHFTGLQGISLPACPTVLHTLSATDHQKRRTGRHLDIVQDGPYEVGDHGEKGNLQEGGFMPFLESCSRLGVVLPAVDIRVPPLGPDHAGRIPVQEQRGDLQAPKCSQCTLLVVRGAPQGLTRPHAGLPLLPMHAHQP